MNLLTGDIYGEKLQLRNYAGEIIEFAIPTSINERILVWVRAGDREWETKSEPNQVFYFDFLRQIESAVLLQVFFESVKADMSGSGLFCLTAVYNR